MASLTKVTWNKRNARDAKLKKRRQKKLRTEAKKRSAKKS